MEGNFEFREVQVGDTQTHTIFIRLVVTINIYSYMFMVVTDVAIIFSL